MSRAVIKVGTFIDFANRFANGPVFHRYPTLAPQSMGIKENYGK
jgi:hypothetical protein